jgi:hypothetical protein
MSMSELEEHSTSASVIYKDLPSSMKNIANATINAFADAVRSPVSRQESFNFRVPERSTVFQSCAEMDLTRADITKMVDSIDGVYDLTKTDDEGDTRSRADSEGLQPQAKRRYVKAKTVHSKL